MPAAVRPNTPARPPRGTLILNLMVGVLVVGVVVLGGPTTSQAASPCPSAPAAVYHVVRPADGVSLYTTNQQEATAASAYGFTDNRGVAFHAALTAQGTMVAAHRLYHPVSGDFLWLADAAERSAAVAQYGYVDQGANFAVSSVDDACLVPVARFVRGSIHRFAVTATDQQALTAAGWVNEGVKFFAAPATGTAPPRLRRRRLRRARRDRCPSARRTTPRRPTPCTRHRAATTPTPARRRRPYAPSGAPSLWRPAVRPSCCVPVAIARA